MQTPKEKTHEEVRAFYAARAGTSSCCDGGCDCTPPLYEGINIDGALSEVANMSLGCGNPIALGRLRPGETVLDLGSGAGFDCFLAARQVGADGKVIGVDMTPEMLERARANAAGLGIANVEFRQGYIEHLPVEDGAVDVIISNCVINLSPDKRQALSEMKRVLKPGGRIAITDIVSMGALAQAYSEDPNSWSACVSGALDVDQWLEWLEELGFEQVTIQPALADLPLSAVQPGTPFSAAIHAIKPGGEGSRAYFDDIAHKWDEMRSTFFSDLVRVQAYAAAHIQTGELAADIGAGTGFITEGLLQRGARVIAVDQSREMLAVLNDKLGGGGELECRAGTSDAIPVETGSVDVVFANMYLHHVEDPGAAIAEMARLLKNGGRLVITDLDEHQHEFLRTEQHDRWMGFRRRDVRGWLKQAGLTSVRSETVGSDCCADSQCTCDSARIGIFLVYGEKRD